MSLVRIAERLESTETILNDRKSFPELALTSMPRLNDVLWGLKRKQITLVSARTSIGKSSFVLQMAWDLAKQGKKVMFLSLEMDLESLLERIFCNEHEIDNFKLMSGQFSKYNHQWKLFKESLVNIPFIASDICGKNWREVDDILTDMSPKPDVVFIDHINHIKSPQGKDKEMIDDYLINFQSMAIKHNIAVVIVAQINRTALDAKDPEPQLHQLKGTGSLEEICSTAILLHWQYKYDQTKDKNLYTAIVAKNRSGRTGFVKLKFQPEFYKFSNLEEATKPTVKPVVQPLHEFKHDQAHDEED